jgi:hypothetical protein
LLIGCIAGCSTFSQAVSTGTMGNTVTGSTNYTGSTQELPSSGYGSYTAALNVARANSIDASQDGTVVSIGVRINRAGGNIMLAIYDDDGGAPGALLGYTNSTAVTATGWMDIELNDPVDVVAGNTYWLAHEADSTTLRTYRNTGSQYTVSASYGSFPDPFGSTSTTNYQVPYRITYSGSPAGYALATQVRLGGDIVSVQSFSFYSSAKGFLRLALYNDNGAGPGDLLWQSSSDAVKIGWNTVLIAAGQPSTLPNLVPGVYWLAFQWGSSSAGPNMIDGDPDTGYSMAMSYGAFPSPWDGGSSSATQWSIYATYDIRGSVTPEPTPRASGAFEENAASEAAAVPTAAPVVTPVPSAVPSADGGGDVSGGAAGFDLTSVIVIAGVAAALVIVAVSVLVLRSRSGKNKTP